MKNPATTFAELFARARKLVAYRVEGAIMEFTEELCKLMHIQGVTKTELAQRLGCKPAYITKLLSGQNNFTIQTMVKTADAIGAEIRIHLQPAGVQSHWVDLTTFNVTNTISSPGPGTTPTVEFSRVAAFPSPAQGRPQATPEQQAANEELALAA
jgi:plasmid maintenance system antidote protein VapI